MNSNSKSRNLWGYFVGLLTLVASLIGIYPIIKNWSEKEEGIQVYLSDDYLLNPNKEINIFYSLPSTMAARLTTLPFPLIIKNSSNNSLNNFYINFTAPKRIGINGVGIRRLVPVLERFPDTDTNQETQKLLCDIVFSDKDSLNIIGNYLDGKRTIFYGNKKYYNLVLLNVAYDTFCSPGEYFDSFQLFFTLGADGLNPQNYIFNIRAFYNDSPEFEKYIKCIYSKTDDKFMLFPEIGKENRTGDNKRHIICYPQCKITNLDKNSD